MTKQTERRFTYVHLKTSPDEKLVNSRRYTTPNPGAGEHYDPTE